MLKLLDFLYLDGYRNLSEKYADPDREFFEIERHSAHDNYKYYMNVCFTKHDFKAMLRMRRAKRKGEYLELYSIQKQVENTYL